MPFDLLGQLALFAVATLYTPGPNNVMLTSSGARFGFLRSLPHLLGVAFGFPFMLFVIALGLGAIFEQSSLFKDGLHIIGAAIMLYIGWKIATAKRDKTDSDLAQPFTFAMAAGFQFVNPKAWSMAIGVSGAYIPGISPVKEAFICAAIFTAMGLGSAALWTGFGVAIRSWLEDDVRFRMFNLFMGLSVAACALMLFL